MVVYQICKKCVMDTSDPGISFNENGVCNHCRDFKYPGGEQRYFQWENIVDHIKKDGKDKQYDCVMGLSGGLDSSYALYLIKRKGLRPYCFSIDNGMDNTDNVSKLVSEYGLEINYIPASPEYRDLQRAFLRAGVMNVEIPTDHLITVTLFKKAVELGVKYIITGSNIVTEAIMPRDWSFDARDWRHIRDVHKRFGTGNIDNFPHATLWDWFNWIFIKRIKWVSPLNYCRYDIKEAKAMLNAFHGWQDYGEKHEENNYTKYCQDYYWPIKYGIDKKRAHYSTLINSGQMTRKEALLKLETRSFNYYTNRIFDLEQNLIDKIGINAVELHQILKEKPRSHMEFKNNKIWFDLFAKIAKKVATNG